MSTDTTPAPIGADALRMVLQDMRHPAYPPFVSQFADAIEAALASPAAQGDALDAARYRWLRSCNLAKHPAVRDGFELGDAHLDAAIDAARAARSQTKEGGAA